MKQILDMIISLLFCNGRIVLLNCALLLYVLYAEIFLPLVLGIYRIGQVGNHCDSFQCTEAFIA
jgi:hypothetical protein